MSYDLAVWVGRKPADDVAAHVEFERRARAAGASNEPPSPVMDASLTAVLSCYPDQDQDQDDEYGPWATNPLREGAHGDFAYLSAVPGTPTDVLLWIAQTAAAHGLVCYDPQVESVVSG